MEKMQYWLYVNDIFCQTGYFDDVIRLEEEARKLLKNGGNLEIKWKQQGGICDDERPITFLVEKGATLTEEEVKAYKETGALPKRADYINVYVADRRESICMEIE